MALLYNLLKYNSIAYGSFTVTTLHLMNMSIHAVFLEFEDL